MKLTFEHLRSHPEHYKTVANWLESAWGAYYPDYSDQDWIDSQVPPNAGLNEFPITYIALDHSTQPPTPMGTVFLRAGHPEVFSEPCVEMAGLFVPETQRRKGIGSYLIQEVCHAAKGLGYDQIFLFTYVDFEIYLKNGWEITKHFKYRNKDNVIMQKLL